MHSVLLFALTDILIFFQDVLGDKLVKEFMFESDFSLNPMLPSPNQLKYKILVKNKKLRISNNALSIQKVCAYMPACNFYTLIFMT